MEQELFCSRDLWYKRPYGAVKCGQTVHFNLRVPRRLGISEITFFAESDAGEYFEKPIPWRGLESDCDVYGAKFSAPGTPCVLRYGFILDSFPDKFYLKRLPNGASELCRERPSELWQLTVFSKSAARPYHNYGEGITYHIFADRFARAQTAAAPADGELKSVRRMHTDWDECPEFLPDERGEITNNDFFGGNLRGIIQKLPYLKRLSVSTIYLSPIFESSSNHRYDTGDYMKIDPLLGTEKDFTELCRAAEKLDIRIILDGVFNHTGSCSKYFNRTGTYPDVGAYQSEASPYYSWYSFEQWPDKYSCWWGIKTLPQVNENNADYRSCIFGAKDSVVRHWLKAGASGWRLDVADELPDDFISGLADAARRTKKDAVIIGEVWEDASTKISYGQHRRYILNGALDGVMNYPLYNAILGFLRGGSSEEFIFDMEQIRENYPKSVFYSLMNHIGTHDTVRILTGLGCCRDFTGQSKSFRAEYRLSPEERALGIARLKLGSLIQYCFPGSPTVYYGDEAGMEGFEDPLNRRTYPWGRECTELVDWYVRLGELRRSLPALKKGSFEFAPFCDPELLIFRRSFGARTVTVAVNRGQCEKHIRIDSRNASVRDLISGGTADCEDGSAEFILGAMSGAVIV